MREGHGGGCARPTVATVTTTADGRRPVRGGDGAGDARGGRWRRRESAEEVRGGLRLPSSSPSPHLFEGSAAWRNRGGGGTVRLGAWIRPTEARELRPGLGVECDHRLPRRLRRRREGGARLTPHTSVDFFS